MTWHGVIVLSQYLVVSSEPDVTTSHLTNPAKDAGQVIGYVEAFANILIYMGSISARLLLSR